MRTLRKLGTASALKLGIAGQFFTLNGQPWTAIESSEFSLYSRYTRGEDIRPVLAERQAIGFNLLRVWLLNTSVVPGGILPSQYPDFYARLAPFAALCASYGCCVEFTAFTQTQTLMPSVRDQTMHWARTADALRGCGNVLLELVNEADQHDNATDPSLLTMRPPGILASSGSNGAGALAPTPVWDYGLYHSNDLSEWQRKCAHNAFEKVAELHHIPAMANENTRYPDRDASLVHAEDAAAGAALLSAGACFHSNSGKLSRPFDDVEFSAAIAWVRGAESVPLWAQLGRYIHRTDLESTKPCPSHTGDDCATCGGGGTVIDYDADPCYIRAYERRLPDGRGHIVRIRA